MAENDGLSAEDLALLGDPDPQPDPKPDPAPDPKPDPAPAPDPAPDPDPKPDPKPEPVAADWRASIADAKLAEYAKRFTSPGDLVQTTLKLRDEVSQRIKVPGADASDDDKVKFRKAIGVPDKPEDYTITLPDGVEASEDDQRIIEMVLPLAHANGVPQAALSGFVADFLQKSHDLETVATQAIKKAHDDAEAQLKKEWGADYEPHLNLANRAAEVIGGEEFKSFLTTTEIKDGGRLGDHPAMVRFLATIGRRTDEGDLMIGSTADEKASLRQQLDELNKNTPPGTAAYKDRAHQKKLTEIYDALYGKAPIVGSETRAA